jgi:flavin reductase (DIM6/NTAB) family NADH-FMN oxidoreductase RutF
MTDGRLPLTSGEAAVTDRPPVSLPASDFTPGEMYLLLRDSVLPRPIAWVSTISEDGATNLAPFSFFNVCSPSPPVLGFSCGPRGDNHNAPGRIEKDTERNIRACGEFVVNVAPEALFDAVIRTADNLPHGRSEFTHAGLTEAPSTVVRPPRVAGAPIAYECRLLQIVELGTNHWIMGTVQHVHIAPEVYVGTAADAKRHRVDLLAHLATRPIGRLGRANYVRLREIETRLRSDGPN